MINIKSTNTILYCKHWEEVVAFYRDKLLLPVTTSMDWFVEFKLSETSRISVANEARTSIDSSAGRGITITLEVDNIKTTHSFLVGSGLSPSLKEDRAWGADIIHIHDPEGNRIEFWAPRVH